MRKRNNRFQVENSKNFDTLWIFEYENSTISQFVNKIPQSDFIESITVSNLIGRSKETLNFDVNSGEKNSEFSQYLSSSKD